MVCNHGGRMRTCKMKCENGCHGQVGVIVGPLQLEAGWDLSKLKFGVQAEVNRQMGALTALVYFGPFQFAGGLRWRAMA